MPTAFAPKAKLLIASKGVHPPLANTFSLSDNLYFQVVILQSIGPNLKGNPYLYLNDAHFLS